MSRIVFLIGRRVRRVRARIRAAQERARLARSVVSRPVGPVAPEPAVDGTLFVLAHQDDDLLFAFTRLAGELAAGRPVTTVYLTAGDDDDDEWYWRAREAGVRAAYSHLARTDDRWIETTEAFSDQPVTLARLEARPDVTLVFMRLPDGGVEGSGGERSGGQSLRKLWEGRIATISTVDGTATYSLASLHAVLRAIADRIAPAAVVTLDHEGDFVDGDHSDHHVAGYLAERLHEGLDDGPSLTGYLGYPIAERPANLTAEQIAAKEAAFFLYALSDYKTCASTAACSARPEGAWLAREYTAR
ncbi:GlcNAc-PI de-N-acetylase [Frondihabitans sp. PhB188]|uniref:PIG-L family deacetylase n=1 Tax=Frondihabitans sp. PhB188 TaxID=2485200 RepID=UPI000F4A4F80|nr:PIG-L family deacetylase [Frondihabitans sp. PhB188]ROQ39575.1 GlcNAc-PI de-N-acetylase [Frondihabitans sp. PhB188]